MDRPLRSRNKFSNNLRFKSSSLYFLNNISNIDSTDNTISKDNWRDNYIFNPMIIGRGHFSKVYKVKCCSTGDTLGIKILRRKRCGVDKIDEIMHEVEIMQLLNKSLHTGFIRLVKIHTEQSEVGIVMEYASGGALYHVTKDSEMGLPEVYVRIILTKVLSALSFLHQQDIVHLDIKADNILLRYPYPSTDVILTDFGLARKLTKSKIHKEMIGTPDYIAPEVINYEEICFKSDMWSVGVLTYFVLTNISPFSGTSKDETLQRVTKGKYEFLGKLKEENMLEARIFISSLLVKVPEKRLSAEESLCHNFLCNIDIVECSHEKSLNLESSVMNLEPQVKVRPNPDYHKRGLVMSQYDICSPHLEYNVIDSEETFFKVNHIEPFTIINTLEGKNYQECMITSELDIYQIHENVNKTDLIENDPTKVKYKEIVEIDENIINIKEKPEEGYQYAKIISNVQSVLHNEDNPENCLSKISSSCYFTSIISDQKESYNAIETYISESFSTLINTEMYKGNCNQKEETPNKVDKNNNKSWRTENYDEKYANEGIKSSITKMPLVNESFRYSRENMIDKESQSLKNQRITSYKLMDSTDFTKVITQSAIEEIKRQSLSRSVKRDFDKSSNLNERNRRSELVTNTSLLDDHTYESKHSISTSNQSLPTSVNRQEQGATLFDMFKKKKSKVSAKTNIACTLS